MKLLHFESIIDHVKWLFFVQRRGKGGGGGGQKAVFRVMSKYFEIKKAFCYYIKQIVPCCRASDSIIDHRRRQNVVRTSATHSATTRVPLICSYHILTSSVVY